MRLVVIESPLAGRHGAVCTCETCAGDRARNARYLHDAMADCFARSEAPFASHRLYPGVLNDNDPGDRQKGMEAGFAWGDKADLTAVYTDLGISGGMKAGIERAQRIGRTVVFRQLHAWATPPWSERK